MQLAEPLEKLDEFYKADREGTLDKYHQSQLNMKSSKGGIFSQKPIIRQKKGEKQHPSKIFENIVMFLIFSSSILLCVDNPLNDPESIEMKIIAKLDITLTCLFFIEAMIKIIAKGCFYNNMGPIEPYMSSNWNKLDAFVVVASLFDLAFMIAELNVQQLQALKALRALRALRPLRMISRNEGMKLVVNALLASLPSMTNVLLVCSLFILIFSIGGVNFFKGAFYSCQ
jgi:hypothetical protein